MVRRSIEHELRSRNFEARSGDLSRTCWSKIEGNNVAFTKDKEIVGNGKPQGSVWKETNAVSGRMGISVQKSWHSQLLLQNKRRNHKLGRMRDPKVVEVEVRLGEYLVCRARTILKVLVRIHLVKSGILQSAGYTRQRKGCKFGSKCVFAHRKVWRTAQQKVYKERRQKCSCCGERQKIGLCISGHGAAEVFIDFFGRAQPCGNQSEVVDSLKPHCAMPKFETAIHRSTTFAQANLISETRTLQNLRIGLRKRRNGKSIGLAK